VIIWIDEGCGSPVLRRPGRIRWAEPAAFGPCKNLQLQWLAKADTDDEVGGTGRNAAPAVVLCPPLDFAGEIIVFQLRQATDYRPD
jgi:hypothetical protein